MQVRGVADEKLIDRLGKQALQCAVSLGCDQFQARVAVFVQAQRHPDALLRYLAPGAADAGRIGCGPVGQRTADRGRALAQLWPSGPAQR